MMAIEQKLIRMRIKLEYANIRIIKRVGFSYHLPGCEIYYRETGKYTWINRVIEKLNIKYPIKFLKQYCSAYERYELLKMYGLLSDITLLISKIIYLHYC